MLNLYLVRRDVARDGGPDWDATHGFVIVAESEEHARAFAADYRNVASGDRHARDENPEVWMSETTSVLPLGTPHPSFMPGVVLEDHQWG